MLCRVYRTVLTPVCDDPYMSTTGARLSKADRYLAYGCHGEGLGSLSVGFDYIKMPDERREEALNIISDVMRANDAHEFRWYKTDRMRELSCYWDEAEINMMWIGPGQVHIAASTPRPSRPVTWINAGGTAVGWLLPGAVTRSRSHPVT